MRKSILLWVAALIAVGLASSACSEAAADGPPKINYGRDICIECGMIIDDPRFAAAYTTAGGEERVFDDLGGLILTGRETGELDEATVWVSDFDEEVLIEADTAYFVPTLGVTSPMGHGILAFGDHARAMNMADQLGGEVLEWHIVKELPAVEGLVGHHHDDHDDTSTEDRPGHDDHDG